MNEGGGVPGVRVGEKFVSPGRTITEADIVMFAALTGDWTELHTNAEYVKKTIFGQRIAHGLLTLSVASGLALRARRLSSLEVVALLGLDDVKFTAPVFIGDTIWVESEVVEVRPSKSRPGTGVVRLRSVVRNQRNEVVVMYETALMVRM